MLPDFSKMVKIPTGHYIRLLRQFQGPEAPAHLSVRAPGAFHEILLKTILLYATPLPQRVHGEETAIMAQVNIEDPDFVWEGFNMDLSVEHWEEVAGDSVHVFVSPDKVLARMLWLLRRKPSLSVTTYLAPAQAVQFRERWHMLTEQAATPA